MKLSFNSLSIEAETVQEVQALLTLALPHLAPSSAPAVPRASAPAAPVTDRERLLRDAYREQYGKGFSMKGRDGNPLDVLASLENAGWPQAGASQDDSAVMESAPLASLQDDGESFV